MKSHTKKKFRHASKTAWSYRKTSPYYFFGKKVRLLKCGKIELISGFFLGGDGGGGGGGDGVPPQILGGNASPPGGGDAF